MATLRDGDGVPLPKRIANLIAIYDQKGVSAAQLEAKIGRPVAGWTEHDAAQLLITGRSLDRGEIRIEDEFPRPSAADAIGRMGTPPPAAEVASTRTRASWSAPGTRLTGAATPVEVSFWGQA